MKKKTGNFMKQLHFQEHEQFKKLFKEEGIDHLEDRFKVLEAFLQIEQHVTSAELHQILEIKGLPLTHDFVRDTLKLMCRFGFAQKNRFENGLVRYEHRHLGQHHDHMICTKCRNIVEFKNESLEKLQAQIAETYGFYMLQHKMEIYGICSRCLEEHGKLMPLVAAKQGERLVIEDFTGGSGARMRLLTMGLRIGDQIDVVTNIGDGQVVIAVNRNRYVLGRGLAQKIMVKLIRQDQAAVTG
jgi:Fur family ferric uptake transcriptional regulator